MNVSKLLHKRFRNFTYNKTGIPHQKRYSHSGSQNDSKNFWDSPEPMYVGAMVTLWSVVASVTTTKSKES